MNSLRRGEFFADPEHVTVTVSDGNVTLQGYPESTVRGRDIVAEAWHVEGSCRCVTG